MEDLPTDEDQTSDADADAAPVGDSQPEVVVKKPMAKPLVWAIDIVVGALVALLAVFVFGKFNDDKPKATSPDPTSSSGTVVPRTTVKPVPLKVLPMVIDPSKKYTARIDTSAGVIVVELAATDFPKSVNNFVTLARSGFYDGLMFHRTVKDFVIQSGDPKGNGLGGPGYKTATEPPTRPYVIGDLAWAKSKSDAAGDAGSQFFILTGSQAATLGPDYGYFGKVVKGLDVAKVIETKPAGTVKMTKVTITES